MTTIRYVGDYMLLGHLGRGAMGEVWVARQLTLRKTVALKLIRPEYVASDGAKARFLAEARAAARVLHPNIVTLFEYGEHDGALFLAMQYVEGGDLAALLAARRLSARASATLLAKVARAVHHAHQNQVVHRDLKPANILVDESLEPYLTDFGVAKRLDDEATLTRVGDVVGTLRYMAPEQAAGHERITTAADVWGLGAILFEMLAGEPLWDGDPRSVARRLSAEEPRRLRRVCPGLDRDLDTICHACLVREPEGRYASAAALAEDLERWLRGEPIGARPVGAVERTLKWACRHPSTSVAIGVVVACVALWAGLEWRRSVRERTEYRRLLMRQADGAFRAGEDREGYATLGKLAALAPNDPEPRVRLRSALAYRSLALPAVPPLRHGAVLNAVVFGPDDRWIATGGDGGTVKVWDRGRGTLFATASSAAASLHGLAFFGADRLLGFGRGGALDAWAIEAGGLRRLWSRSFPDTVVWAAPVGDATRVAAANVGGGLMVLDAATGDIRFRRAVVTNALTCAAASPDGDWLAVGGSRGEWALVDWARDVVLHRPADDGLGIARVAFGPDRDVVVVGGDDGSLRKLKLGSGVDPVAELTLSAGVTALAFSPDGARLFVGCADGRVDAVDVAPWSLLSKPAFLPHGGPVTSLALSSDGLRGVSADGAGEVRSWDTREGRWLAMPVAMSKWVSRVALAPGGTSFAAASFDGSAGVWDLRPARNQVLVEAADDVLPKHKPLNAVASDRNGAVVVGRENGEIVLFGPGGEGGPVAFGRLPNAIQSLEFDSAGRRLLVGCADGTASLYETATRALLRAFGPRGKVLWRAAFGPNEETVVTLAEDDSIRLWRVSDGVEQDSRTAEPLPGAGPAAIVDIGFDENRTMAAVTTEARASYLWDLAASGRPWTKFGFEAQHEVAAISSRARRFATGCKTGEVVVWDIDQPALPPRVWKLRIPVKRLAWNGEGRFLVAGLGSGEVVRVSTSDGDPPVRLGSLVGGINVVRVVGVSGGEWVFAASQGGECRMWSLSTGAAVSEVFPHPHPVYCAAVLPGADWVITGCNDGAARRWRCRWPSDGDSELGPFAEALGEGDHETVFRRRELVDRVRALLGPARGGGVVP